ncbi:MAG TPA: glycosyltransferase family 2 protein [Anaerolineales bacterium]|nr:glycosyltransferase family 2 protein [Anaerolineales bacterium]
MTLVSIITPSFNQASFLEQTIRSVLEQDYPSIEYIVVDGGSTDGSVEIIKKYASHLAFWVSEKDAGQADAINKGMKRAKGDIVAWLNSDDYYLPRAISSAVHAFEENPIAVMVYGDMLAVDEHGKTLNLMKYQQLTLDDLLCFQIIGQPAVFMRRSAFEQSGGLDLTFHFMLDHHLWIRLSQRGQLVHVSQVWSTARYHAAAKNRAQAVEFGREAFRILDWAEAEPTLSPVLKRLGNRPRASAYRVDARYLLDGGQARSSLKAWGRAFILYPPVALTRLNLLAGALLELLGLSKLRLLLARARGSSRSAKVETKVL